MNKAKKFKSVREFSSEGMKLNDYESWLITLKNKLIRLIVDTRKKQDLSQVDLARMLNTSQSVISAIESDYTHKVTLDYLLKVISSLGVSPKKSLKMSA